MTLRERLKSLQGSGVKIGGIKGNAYIYIGKVDDKLADVIDILGAKQFRRMLRNLEQKKIKLSELPEKKKNDLRHLDEFYEELRKARFDNHMDNLEKFHKDPSEENRKRVAESCRAISEVPALKKATIEKCRKNFNKATFILTEQIKTMDQYSNSTSATSDIEIKDEFMSVDDETYGYRILLIDMFLNGPIWTQSECKRSEEINKAIRSVEEKTAMIID